VDRRAGPGRQGSRHHDRVGVGDGTGGLRPVSFSDGAWSARKSDGGEEESAECAVVGRRLPLLGASGKNFPAISRARHAGRGTLARRLVSSAVPGGVGHIYVIYEISVVGLVTEAKGTAPEINGVSVLWGTRWCFHERNGTHCSVSYLVPSGGGEPRQTPIILTTTSSWKKL